MYGYAKSMLGQLLYVDVCSISFVITACVYDLGSTLVCSVFQLFKELLFLITACLTVVHLGLLRESCISNPNVELKPD